MDQSTTIKGLESTEASGIALKAADDLLQAVDQEKRAAARLVGPVIAALKEAHLIQDHDVPHAQTKLASHDGSLDVLNNLVAHIGRIKAAYEQRLRANGEGVAVAEKVAGVAPLNGEDGSRGTLTSNSSPVVGRRAGLGEKRASDQAMISGLGLSGRLPQ